MHSQMWVLVCEWNSVSKQCRLCLALSTENCGDAVKCADALRATTTAELLQALQQYIIEAGGPVKSLHLSTAFA